MEINVGGYVIRDREAGNIIDDSFKTIEEAEEMVEEYEREDKTEGNYVENFYEVVENPEPWRM